MAAQRRYPGTPPFQEQDANIFFGRGQDTKALLRLIRLKELVVLYGKSGLGKTSLINAGIIPALERINQEVAAEAEGMTYEAMKIRFFAWKDAQSQSPLDTFSLETVAKEKRHPLLEKVDIPIEGLWYAFKNHQLHNESPATYVLFFDQFEELFTYPAEQVEAFKKALSQLLNAHIPADYKQALRERFRADKDLLSKEEKQRLLQPVAIKVVLGIRSDRLSLLDKMSDYLPNILVNMYELKALNSVQARAAIALPATQEGDFGTPKFEYKEAALSSILTHLSGEDDRIEPFQIQYICEHAEQVVQATKKTTLDKNDLGDLSQLFENYYHHKIAEIGDAAAEQKARHLLEDGLLFNGVRLSLLREQITSKEGFGLSAALLKKLENVRLVRAEGRGEQTYYEITHDTLVEPILNAKEERKAQERRRRTLIIGGIGLGSFLIILAGFLWVNSLYQNSKKMASKYLMSEAKQFFERDNPRTTLRLTQEALSFYPKNVEARAVLDSLPLYVANVYDDFYGYLDGNQFSNDNQYLVFHTDVKHNKGTLHVLNLQNFKENTFPNSYSNDEYFIFNHKKNYSPDSKHLVFFTNVKDYEETLHLLNLQNFKEKTFLGSHKNSYSYSPDSKHLVFFTNVKDYEETLHILNLQNFKENTFPNSYNNDEGFSFSPDSKHLVFYTDIKDSTGTLHLLNLQNFKENTFPSSNHESFSFSPDSKHLVFYTDVKDSKGTLHLLNLQNFKENTFPNSYSNDESFSFSPNSKHLLFYTDVKDNKGTLHVLNLQNFHENTFPNSCSNNKNFSFNYSESFSPDSKYLIFYTDVKDSEGKLHVLDLQSFKKNTFPNSYNYQYRKGFLQSYRYSYSPDSKYLVFYTDVKDYEGTLHVLNLQNFKENTFPSSYDYHYNESSYYSPDSKYLVFYTDLKDYKGTLHILNLQNFKENTFPNSYSESYSPDSKYLIFHTDIKDSEDKLHILNLQNFKIHTFPAPYGRIYSPDGKKLAFLSYQGKKLHIINLETMQKIKTIQHQTKIEDFEFSKDSRYLLSTSEYPGSKNGVLKITDLHIAGDLLEYYDEFYAPLTKEERERYGLE